MRLVTWNMRAGGSRTHWTRLVDETRADIAFVQETRAPESFEPDLLDARDYTNGCYAPAAHGKWGSAVWLRNGGLGALTLSGASWWVAGGVVSIKGEEFFACSVHLDSAKPGSYLASAHAFLDALKDLRIKLPVVLSGDWNVSTARRPANDPRQNSKGEVKLLDRMESEFGLVSAWSLLHPESIPPQTLRWAREPATAYHCDGVFVSRQWHDRVRDVTTVNDPSWHRMSDHNPVVVELAPRG